MWRIRGEKSDSARRPIASTRVCAALTANAPPHNAPSGRALPAVRVDPASEPCRAAKADNLPNARQWPTPSAAAKSANGARRLQRQSRDVRALAQVGRHGEAAGVDANGRQREPRSGDRSVSARLRDVAHSRRGIRLRAPTNRLDARVRSPDAAAALESPDQRDIPPVGSAYASAACGSARRAIVCLAEPARSVGFSPRTRHLTQRAGRASR